MSRRGFLSGIFGMAAVSSILFSINPAWAQRRRRRGEDDGEEGDLALPLAEPGVGMAAAINYYHRHEDVTNEALKRPAADGTAWKEQFCKNCHLYSEVGEKDGHKVGKCTILPNQLVRAEGWCSSWAPKS